MYAKVENGKIVEFPIYDIRSRFPNISFPAKMPKENLPGGYVFVAEPTKLPEFDPSTHVLSPELVPELKDDKWVAEYQVRALTKEELEQRRLSAIDEIKATRNQLLRDSDWTQLNDVSLSKEDSAKWKKYRQELRDLTKQPDFPKNVVFPKRPL